MSNGKDMMIHLIVGLIKKILNEIPLCKNEPILSDAVKKFWGKY